MGNALRKNVAVFHQVPAKGVDALGALPHQEIAGAEHDAVRLLLFGFDRNEAHARPLGRFTDGLCIGRIVLLPLDERLDVGRRDQAHIMTQLSDLTRPVARPGTGFHRDDAPGLHCEETEKLRASDALAKEHMPGAIRSMYLEHVLRDVQPIVLTCSTDASFGGSLTPPPWHTDAVGGRPLHHPVRTSGVGTIRLVLTTWFPPYSGGQNLTLDTRLYGLFATRCGPSVAPQSELVEVVRKISLEVRHR